VRGGLSNLYAGAVETAISQNDLDGASGLYDQARVVITPERQAALDRRFVRAREAALYRDVDRDMLGIPIEPTWPPGAEVFAERAAELTPGNATAEVRARIGQVVAFAQRRAERQWNKQQSEAGVAALDWLEKNPGGSFLAIPPDIRDWLAPDQWRGLEAFYIEGRLTTDRDLFEQLDRWMICEPDVFVGVDLDRHRLSLDDEDHARFVDAQKAIVEDRLDPGHVRYDWLRRGIDRTLKRLGINTDGPAAVKARADARDRLKSFEAIEGRPPVGADIEAIVAGSTAQVTPDGGNIIPAAAGDLKCVGGACKSGGSWGTTGMYRIEGKNLCRNCAIKQLGIGNDPAQELMKSLEKYLPQRRTPRIGIRKYN
jgi:hypothetical protein